MKEVHTKSHNPYITQKRRYKHPFPSRPPTLAPLQEKRLLYSYHRTHFYIQIQTPQSPNFSFSISSKLSQNPFSIQTANVTSPPLAFLLGSRFSMLGNYLINDGSPKRFRSDGSAGAENQKGKGKKMRFFGGD